MSDNENNFETLRQLLAHKRQELPPPGYFAGFSSQVAARLRQAEAELPQSAQEELFSQAPWLMRLLQNLELKPAFAGAFASELTLLLVLGIVYAERPDSQPDLVLESSTPSAGTFASAQSSAFAPALSTDFAASNSAVASLQPVASLFGSQSGLVQPVSFLPAGH